MINPYNFVRSGKAIPRRPARHLGTYSGRTGTVVCRLTALTPIFTRGREEIVGGRRVLGFFKLDRAPALPASSLKGMLRLHAEALANGCGPFLGSREHPPCPTSGGVRRPPALCVVCRTFGHLSRERVYPGRLRFSDARACDGWKLGAPVVLKELGSPKPRHRPFYEPGGRESGRKFYYHHAPSDMVETRRPTHRNAVVEPLLQGVFDFRVGFVDLDDVELGLVLHTLELPAERYHKFGMAKPLGLGTVRVDIMGFEECASPAARYSQFDSRPTRASVKEGETEGLGQVGAWIDQAKNAYTRALAAALGVATPADLWAIRESNLIDLDVMLSMVPYGSEIRYPGFRWFQDPINAVQALPSIQRIAAGDRLPT